MIETEKSRKKFVKQTGRTNLGVQLSENARPRCAVGFAVPCPVCYERRRKKAEAMKRYRNKKATK